MTAPEIRDCSLADIAAMRSADWAQMALAQYLARAGEAVGTAPAEALRDIVETFACSTCNGCGKKVPDWEQTVPSGLTYCTVACLLANGEPVEVREYHAQTAGVDG